VWSVVKVCAWCSWKVLKKTFACMNNHRACKQCYYHWARAGMPTATVTRTVEKCPVCRVIGAFIPAPHVDAELPEQPVRCPYRRASTGVACRWVGRFGDMHDHVHRFPDPPRDVAAADNRHD